MKSIKNKRNEIKMVVGLAVDKYVDSKVIFDKNIGDYNDFPCEREKYTLFFAGGETLSLWEIEGMCGSGCTSASWGYWKWEYKKRPFSHIPVGHRIKVEVTDDTNEIHIRSLTEVDEDGDPVVVAEGYYDYDDPYYPMGGIHVNLDLFSKVPRAMEKRPVWIFTGASALGKSTLGAELGENKIVFETDTCRSQLPEVIWADIIIAGKRKGGFSIEEIKKSLPDGVKPIIVEFKE